MASLWVAEGDTQVIDSRGQLVPVFRLKRVQQITIGAAPDTAANNFAAGTTTVMVTADAACHINIGTSPTAAGSDFRLPANAVLFLGGQSGENIAVIQEGG